MANDLEAPKPFVPSGFSDGNKLDAGGIEQMRFGLAGSGPLAKAVLDSNAVGTMRQLIGGGATPTTTIPVGTISPYAGTSAPANWLLCDGSAVSRATYAALFDVTGTAYGAGDGSTTFNVPDLRGRIVVGSGTGAQQGAAGSGVITGGAALAARIVGQFFGDERLQNHNHTQDSHNHTQNSHNHTQNNHSHQFIPKYGGSRGTTVNMDVPGYGNDYGLDSSFIGGTTATNNAETAINQAQTATNQASGAGTGANTQPSVVTAYIIKAIADVTNTFGVALSGVAGGGLTGTYPNPDVVYGHKICTSTSRPVPLEGMMAYETDTQTLIVYSGGRWMQADAISNRNLIINGGMSVAQRGTSTAGSTAGGYLTADRWQGAINALGTWTNSQESDGPAGISKSWKWLCTTADASPAAADYMIVRQGIEGQNLQQLLKGTASAKQVAVSFWVKSNVTGTYIVYLNDNPNARFISASYTIVASATWEYKTVTFVGDTSGVLPNDSSAGIYLAFLLGIGSNSTSVPLQTTWAAGVTNLGTGQVNVAAAINNFWQVTGVQFEVGSAPSNFEFESFETTLRKCQRYFTRVAYSSSAYIATAMCRAANAVYWSMPLPVYMRIIPTISNALGTWAVVDAAGIGRGVGSFGYQTSGNNLAGMSGVGFNLVAGNAGTIFASTDVTFDASAEL